MAKTRVIKKHDKGLRSMKTFIDKLHKQSVSGGFFAEQGKHGGSRNTQDLTYPELMAIMEAGSTKYNIPARPVFQLTYHTSDKILEKVAIDTFKKHLRSTVFSSTVHPIKTLDIVGIAIQKELRKNFYSPLLEENKDWWENEKRMNGNSTKPLTETDELVSHIARKNSINKKVKL